MQTFIMRRIMIGIVILIFLSLLVFVLMQFMPGDPAELRCGFSCGPAQIEAWHERLGLNKPLFPISFSGGAPFVHFGDSQYGSWVKSLFNGDLGVSSYYQQPVSKALRQRFPVTFELMVLTMIFTILIGVPFGIISAVWRNSPVDYFVRSTAILGLSVPNFWIGTLVLIVPVALWQYSPPLGRTVSLTSDPIGNLKQFGPPAAVLALASAAGIMRLARSSLLEVMRQDYMRTARAKGLRERAVVLQHGMKNSLIPVVTVLGLQLAGLLGGAIIIEQIFTLPGLGQYVFQELLYQDSQVVQTMTVYIGAVVIGMNLLVDVSYAWFDPRIRYS